MSKPSHGAEARSLRDYLRVLRENRVLVISATILAALAALAFAAVREPVYEATATVSFKEKAEDLQAIGLATGAPNPQPTQQAAADAALVTRPDVVKRVQTALGGEVSPQSLRDVTAQVQPTSNLVAITATARDGEQAAQVANTFAREVQKVVRDETRASYERSAERLRTRLESESDGVTAEALGGTIALVLTLSTIAEPVEINRPAEVPGKPVSPKPIRDSLIATLIGFLIGTGAAFLRRSGQGGWSESHQVERDLGLPLVGTVSGDALGGVGLASNGGGPFHDGDLEPFRIMRSNVASLAKDRPLRTVAVTSALTGEGKSTVAAWYAFANARAGRRTLLVECDFRRPVLAARLGISPTPGLSEYIERQDVSPEAILRPIAVHGDHATPVMPVLPAGNSASEPAEMIASARFHDFIDHIARQYDLVVFDTASMLPVGDTLELLPQVDGILLCLRLGQTTRERAEAAMAKLSRFPAKPTGLVVTGIRRGSEDDYQGYYSHVAASKNAA